jgi:hypothetical protein
MPSDAISYPVPNVITLPMRGKFLIDGTRFPGVLFEDVNHS